MNGSALLPMFPLGWTGTVNVTYWGTPEPLAMHEAWRKNNPKVSSGDSVRPFCVVARMGEF